MDYSRLYNGDHLKRINPSWTFKKWSYRLSFEAKMRWVLKYLDSVSKNAKILDAGCGQGLLVEELVRRGYDVIGIDAFYESQHVRKLDIFANGYPDNSFDLILCLDVIEHFVLGEQQERLVKELNRLLSPKGTIVFSIPNLAHLSSRFWFFFTGRLLRTAKVEYHPGDRPISEYYQILKRHMYLTKRKGISPTIPVLFQLTQLWPQYFAWLHHFLSVFSFFPNWCFNVIVLCKKKSGNNTVQKMVQWE